ncbi:hypothetical protein [Tsukamurella strandjordii]|uniref:hypothetical protein n=1 Tax=Tsukamurella strandjordii TaxID=147577 RepID=UPI0031DF7FB8
MMEMPRPDARKPGEDQGSLFGVASSPTEHGHKRHSLAFARAIKAAQDRELLEDVDEAAASLAMAGAWSLDEFEAQNKPYGPSKIVGELRELLGVMHMTPEARNTQTEANIADLMDRLEEMDSDDASGTEIPHTR